MGNRSALPFAEGERDPTYQDVQGWSLSAGTKKSDPVKGMGVSIFTYNSESRANSMAAAKCAVLRAKTLRHPGILSCIETLETDKEIVLVTEGDSLFRWLQETKAAEDGKRFSAAVMKGIHDICRALV